MLNEGKQDLNIANCRDCTITIRGVQYPLCLDCIITIRSVCVCVVCVCVCVFVSCSLSPCLCLFISFALSPSVSFSFLCCITEASKSFSPLVTRLPLLFTRLPLHSSASNSFSPIQCQHQCSNYCWYCGLISVCCRGGWSYVHQQRGQLLPLDRARR